MLGKLTHELVTRCCPISHQQEIIDLLSQQCSDNLPGIGRTPEWDELVDRVQLAAIRGSDWNLDKIKASVSMANVDWRDLLVGAGFGTSLSAHQVWQQRAIESHDVSK